MRLKLKLQRLNQVFQFNNKLIFFTPNQLSASQPISKSYKMSKIIYFEYMGIHNLLAVNLQKRKIQLYCIIVLYYLMLINYLKIYTYIIKFNLLLWSPLPKKGKEILSQLLA